MTEGLRIAVAGATGYIGRQAARELAARGHRVLALVRPASLEAARAALPGIELRAAEATEGPSLEAALRGERLDGALCCLASRSGAPADALRVDRDASLAFFRAAQAAGARHLVLLSAICVQKPRLAFQHAKLEVEAWLRASGASWSIVRPTAFFKSLAGQVEKVKRGQPFAVFGDGRLTACTPLSEADLARFLADCFTDPLKRDAVLPVGGPGPALTPLDQVALLERALGRPVKVRHVPVGLLDAIIAALSALGALVPALKEKAELARIGRYYATESMLAWDPAAARYDRSATPSTGSDTLADFYARVVREGLGGQELGAAAVFDRGGQR